MYLFTFKCNFLKSISIKIFLFWSTLFDSIHFEQFFEMKHFFTKRILIYYLLQMIDDLFLEVGVEDLQVFCQLESECLSFSNKNWSRGEMKRKSEHIWPPGNLVILGGGPLREELKDPTKGNKKNKRPSSKLLMYNI